MRLIRSDEPRFSQKAQQYDPNPRKMYSIVDRTQFDRWHQLAPKRAPLGVQLTVRNLAVNAVPMKQQATGVYISGVSQQISGYPRVGRLRVSGPA